MTALACQIFTFLPPPTSVEWLAESSFGNFHFSQRKMKPRKMKMCHKFLQLNPLLCFYSHLVSPLQIGEVFENGCEKRCACHNEGVWKCEPRCTGNTMSKAASYEHSNSTCRSLSTDDVCCVILQCDNEVEILNPGKFFAYYGY